MTKQLTPSVKKYLDEQSSYLYRCNRGRYMDDWGGDHNKFLLEALGVLRLAVDYEAKEAIKKLEAVLGENGRL